jgi:2-polyprenyl-6-methoxyphenol hydroxylase-like FAD-dependent oxidoreductase
MPEDFFHVRRPWGHAKRYGAPGALILGDAAHPVSPAGGQGANMSIADAKALAEAFLREPTDPLPEYESRRRPANARSLNFTRLAALGMRVPSLVRNLAYPRALRWFGRRPHRFARLLRTASTAFQDAGVQASVAVPE